MKVYSYSEARQKLSEVLDIAAREDVMIKRRGGEAFIVRREARPSSPLDVPGIKASVSVSNILAAVRSSRERG